MATQLKPGQHVIWNKLDNYPPANRLLATVVKVAEPWTTGMVPVQIRCRGSLIWVPEQVLEAQDDASLHQEPNPLYGSRCARCGYWHGTHMIWCQDDQDEASAHSTLIPGTDAYDDGAP